MYSDAPTHVCSDKVAGWTLAGLALGSLLLVALLMLLASGCAKEPTRCGIVKRTRFVADCFGTEKGCTQILVNLDSGGYADSVSYGITEVGDRGCMEGMDQIFVPEK